MLRYVFVTMLLLSTAPISQGLEIGDTVLQTSITASDAGIKFANFHGKSNLLVVRNVGTYPEFSAQLDQKTEAFKAQYNVTVLHLKEEGEIFLVDKSGYVRWKFPTTTDATQPSIEQLESELKKLKRDNPLPIGSPAPDFRLIDAETGLLVSLSQFKGEKHVLATLLLQTY